MNLESARSLSAHINEHSTRFTATVLDFAHQAWVILRDNKASQAQTYVEPILDVADYLVRADRRSPRIDDDYRNLLVGWLEQNKQEPNAGADAPPRQDSHTAERFLSQFRY